MKARKIVPGKARAQKKSPTLMDAPEACAFAALAGVAATLATLAAEDVAGKDPDQRNRDEALSFLARAVACADQILRRGRRS